MSGYRPGPKLLRSLQSARVVVPVLCAILLAVTPGLASGGEIIPFLFPLSGQQQVPPVETEATGGCSMVLDVMQVNITCAHSVVNATAAHIHSGAPGASGPILFDLGDPSSSPFSANLPGWTPQNIADLLAGNLYVNIHSSTNPGGELRGQMVEPQIDRFVATLSEGQEVPPTGSVATGSCLLTLGADLFSLTVNCEHAVSMATAAHLHGGAVGVNGPVRLDLGNAASPMVSIVTPFAPDLAELVAGLLYVNVHSGAFPGGEIRGQVLADEVFADGFEDGATSAWSSSVP